MLSMAPDVSSKPKIRFDVRKIRSYGKRPKEFEIEHTGQLWNPSTQPKRSIAESGR